MADNKIQKTKHQHYVPRCYLKNFASVDQQFFSFDKVHRKSKTASVAQSAQEEFFYDFHESTLQNPEDDPQHVEKKLSKIEGRFKVVLDDFIASASAGGVTAQQADIFAGFVAIQWLRTKSYRASALEINQKAFQALLDQLYALNSPGIPPGRFRPGEGYAQALHAELLFDPDHMWEIAEGFRHLLWVIGDSGTAQPFYTSDEPVARRANCTVNSAPAVGILDPGIEYAYPLNSKFILLMVDRHTFPGLQQSELKTISLSESQIERYNGMQVMKSGKYVFCQKDDFTLAQRLCEEHPIICDPDRERARVDSTPVVDQQSGTFVTALE